MGAVRGKRVHLIGPLPSASWDVVLMGGGSHPWWFAVLGTGRTLWGQNAGKMEAMHRAIAINSHSHTSTGDRLGGFCSGACLTSGRLLLKEGGRRRQRRWWWGRREGNNILS